MVTQIALIKNIQYHAISKRKHSGITAKMKPPMPGSIDKKGSIRYAAQFMEELFFSRVWHPNDDTKQKIEMLKQIVEII